MICPVCNAETSVYSTISEETARGERLEPYSVRRHRKCQNGHRFRSTERVQWESTIAPVVGKIEPA